jgi:hypothetical protein
MQYAELDAAKDFIAPSFAGIEPCGVNIDLWINAIVGNEVDEESEDYFIWQEWTRAWEWFDGDYEDAMITGSNETGYTITINQDYYDWLAWGLNQTDGYVTIEYAWVVSSDDYPDFTFSANFTVGIQAEYTWLYFDDSDCALTNIMLDDPMNFQTMQYADLNAAMDFIAPSFSGTGPCGVEIDLWINVIENNYWDEDAEDHFIW